MLGTHLLFTNLIADDKEFVQSKQGRSPELDAARNEMICCRYYFYLTFSLMRYDAIIDTLSSEFFLSNTRVVAILKKHIATIKNLRVNNVTRTELAKKYPNWNWTI